MRLAPAAAGGKCDLKQGKQIVHDFNSNTVEVQITEVFLAAEILIKPELAGKR